MARFRRRKNFETTDRFPTIPVQKSVETIARFRTGEKSLKQRMDFQQSQWKKSAETMARFRRRKKFETTDGFPTIPVQKSIETMARFGRGKIFKTTDGFPTIPVQKSVETMARFVRG